MLLKNMHRLLWMLYLEKKQYLFTNNDSVHTKVQYRLNKKGIKVEFNVIDIRE